MGENELLVTKLHKTRAKRTIYRQKPRARRSNHIWGNDLTKVKITSWVWLYLVIVLDWYTEEIIGYTLSLQSKTEDWLDALEKAVNNRFPEGIRASMDKTLLLVSDNGCQPTSQRYMKSCAALGIKQVFASWSNPKGNG